MSINEKDLKKLAEEQSTHIEIPDSLKPEQIEKMLESRGKKKQKQYYGKIAGLAACGLLVVGVAAIGTRGLGSSGDPASDSSMLQADQAGGAEITAESGAQEIAEARAEDTADIEAADAGSTAAGAKGQKNGSADQAQSAGKFEVTEIRTAKNYDEIYEYLNTQFQEREAEIQEYAAADGAAMDTGSSAGGSAETKSDEAAVANDTAESGAGFSDTNVREEGVGEADIVKTDGKRLYIVNNQQIQIVDIQKEDMNHLSTIRLDKECYVSEIFVKDDRLVAVYNRSEYRDQGDASADGYGGMYLQYTVAETFDISKPEKPKSLGKISQSGNYNTMRVSGDHVYLLSDFYTNFYGAPRSELDAYIPTVQGKQIASSDILMPSGSKADKYTIISSFSLKDPEKKADSKAVFGSAGLCYVSKENIYICESDRGSYGIMPLARQGGSSPQNVSKTCIRKISYKNGKLKAVGQTEVDGTLNDSFSIDEYDGNLRMVVTVMPLSADGVGELRLTEGAEEELKETNALYILDENLEELSRIEGLAKDEIVYSARFMGDTGYFVTFRQMDPLFSVDLSDPKNPEILGQLKIPGFSEYLHPYGEGLLLGIGMDADETGTTTEGVKLSMFDISDPANVKEAEKYVLENTYSSSVFYDYKAAFVDVEKNLIGFPADGDLNRYMIFSYGENGFECLFDRELSGYAWNVRAMYSGSRLYLVAGNTVESYDMKSFEKVDDIVL